MKRLPKLTNKLEAIITGFIAGTSAFIAWLVSLPPENQDALIKPMIELTPLDWRPTIGFISRGIATLSTIVMAYKAAQSGPQTPPKNSPTE